MIVLIFVFLAFIYSVILHELAHGWVADRLGDPTARLSGRLTLDPRSHIDPIMSIALPLVLAILGMPIFGAAKPVPVDPFNFREGRKDMAIVALSGPATNILIAAFFGLLLRLFGIVIINPQVESLLSEVCLLSIRLNLFLAFFNLIPLPPLDGYRVVAGVLPKELALFWASLERFGFWLIFLVIFFFGNIISLFVSPLVAFFYRLFVG